MCSPALGMSLRAGRAGSRRGGQVWQPRARVADHDIASRENDGLTHSACTSPRGAQVEIRQLPVRAGGGVYTENRDAVRELHEFHRRGPARVHLDRMCAAAADDEVHSVDACQAELPGNGITQRGRISTGVVMRHQDVAAVLIACRAEPVIADELPRDTERHAAASCCRKHHRAGHALDELLQVAASREPGAGTPAAHTAAAAGGKGFHKPEWFTVRGSRFMVHGSGFKVRAHCGNGEAALP